MSNVKDMLLMAIEGEDESVLTEYLQLITYQMGVNAGVNSDNVSLQEILSKKEVVA
jgi:hypothetical protein